MKAVSIKQPWASLIAHGIKDIENRTWKTNFRGKIYIHASAKLAAPKNKLGDLMPDNISANDLDWYGWVWNKEYPVSAIIGEVEIVDCVINHQSIWAEKSDVEPCKEDFTWHIEGTSGKSFDGDSYDIAMKKFKESKTIYKDRKSVV